MKSILRAVFVLVGGAIASYVVGILASPKERTKTKKQIQSALKKIDWDDTSQKILGQSSAEMRQQLQEILEAFQDQIHTIKSRFENIDGNKYNKMVDLFIKKLEDDSEFTKAQIKKLSHHLRNDFKMIES